MKDEQTWPMPIGVGDLVFSGVTSPDVGEVLSITKNGRWAAVKWRCNGVRKRNLVADLWKVNQALTEFVVRRRGQKPCPSCGYHCTDVYGRETETTCILCDSSVRGPEPTR